MSKTKLFILPGDKSVMVKTDENGEDLFEITAPGDGNFVIKVLSAAVHIEWA